MTANDEELYVFTMGVATGEIDETGAATFFRYHSAPVKSD